MADIRYVTTINGNPIAASQIKPGSALETKITTMETTIAELEGIGAFEIATLTSGANPVPDVADPSTKTIYLTKADGSSASDPYTEWIYIAGTPSGTWEIIGESSIDLDGYKTTQEPVADPSASGTAVEFISNISQNANGEITVSKKTVSDVVASVGGVGGSSGLMGASDKEKLDGIEAGAQVNVKSDWDAPSGAANEILNKPDMSSFVTESEMTTALSGKQDTIDDLAAIRGGAAAGATALQPGDIETDIIPD